MKTTTNVGSKIFRTLGANKQALKCCLPGRYPELINTMKPVLTQSCFFSSVTNKSFNLEGCLKKGHETLTFTELAQSPVDILEGVGPKTNNVLETLNVKTVSCLAGWKFAKWAEALAVLKDTEDPTSLTSTAASIETVLDKAYETKKLHEIVTADVAAIQGISEEKGELLASVGIKTIEDLARWKFYKRAKAIVVLAEAENTDSQIDIWN